MANLSDDELQRMGKEELKETFEKNFSEKLTHILEFVPNTFVEVETARKILQTVNHVAITYGKNYIAEDQYLWVFTECTGFEGFEVSMGQQRCFMQLLRECDPESELGNRLAQIKDLAAFLGNKLSGYILRMMVMMNAENRKIRMNKFRDFECLFPFLKDAIKWEGETNDFGVVYNRIIVLLKHAHKEFSQVERSRIPEETVVNTRRNLMDEECPEKCCDRLLNDILLLISMLESLLSFPLLPDMPRLSTATRSIEWLLEELVVLEKKMYDSFEVVKSMLLKYKREIIGVREFLRKMELPTDTIWNDLEQLVQDVEESSASIQEVQDVKESSASIQEVQDVKESSASIQEVQDVKESSASIQEVQDVKESSASIQEVQVESNSMSGEPSLGTRQRVRLYVRGTILGYKRCKSIQYPNTSLVQIEGVNTKEEAVWYAGKRMAFIYRAKVKKNGSHYRCIWGKVSRPHGNSGIVRAKFKSNLPPKSLGVRVRVFMYPSNI